MIIEVMMKPLVLDPLCRRLALAAEHASDVPKLEKMRRGPQGSMNSGRGLGGLRGLRGLRGVVFRISRGLGASA